MELSDERDHKVVILGRVSRMHPNLIKPGDDPRTFIESPYAADSQQFDNTSSLCAPCPSSCREDFAVGSRVVH